MIFGWVTANRRYSTMAINTELWDCPEKCDFCGGAISPETAKVYASPSTTRFACLDCGDKAEAFIVEQYRLDMLPGEEEH
jgi:biotin synthase-like enzyme